MQIVRCGLINLKCQPSTNFKPKASPMSFGISAVPTTKGAASVQNFLNEAMQAIVPLKTISNMEADRHLKLIAQILDAMDFKMIGDAESQNLYKIAKEAKEGLPSQTRISEQPPSSSAQAIWDSLFKATNGICSEKNFLLNDSNLIFRKVSIILNDIADRMLDQQDSRKVHSLSGRLRKVVENRNSM